VAAAPRGDVGGAARSINVKSRPGSPVKKFPRFAFRRDRGRNAMHATLVRVLPRLTANNLISTQQIASSRLLRRLERDKTIM